MQDDTTDSTDASLSECGHERFERNHYFHGKLMTARDMQAEQAYNVGQRRAQARNVGGSGVAWGLKAEIENDGEDAIRVYVHEGYGVDECGRPIVVPKPYDNTITGSKADGPTLSVYLKYDSCLKESVPVDGGQTACEDECAYNRVLEVYDVEVRPGLPDKETVGKPVEPVEFPGWNDLGSVSDKDRSLPGEYDEVYSTIASSYWEETQDTVGAETEESSLYLGSFETDDNGNWGPTDEVPTQYLYTNDMLYAGIARHTADFGNPHETSLRTVSRDSEYETGLQVRDDGSANPQVVMSSTDETVDVIHTPGEQRIDLSVKAHVDKIVDKRIEPLERYAVERALKYKALVFERAAERFDGQAGGIADDVATLAREAVDTRLVTASHSTEGEEPKIHLEGGDGDGIDAEDYAALLREFLDLEERFRNQVDDQVTDASYQRLSNAIGGLKSTLEPSDPSTLEIGAAEDDVADAVEWLEELEEEPEPEPEPADAQFATDGGSFEEHRGDIAEISVELENTRSATLTVGTPETEYQSTVEIQSGGGGAVTVLMNTYLAGRNAGEENRAFGTADPADSATARLDTDVEGIEQRETMLSEDTYSLSLSVDGEDTDEGTLSLEARSTDDLTVRRGSPNAYNALTTTSEIESAVSRGALDDGDVERGDTVAAEIEVTGVYGAIAAASGSATAVDANAIKRLDKEGLLELDVTQSRGINTFKKHLELWRSVDGGAARLLADPAENRIYLVFNTGRAVFVQENGERARPGPGEGYEVQFGVVGNTLLAAEAEDVSDAFNMAGRQQVEVPDVEGDPYQVATSKAENKQLSLDPTYRQIQSTTTLDRYNYDTINTQEPEAGTTVDAGSEIQVEVWTSRPITVIPELQPEQIEELHNQGIEYVHQLEEVDTSVLTNRISGVGDQTAGRLKDVATDYRIANDLAIREGTTFQDALNVSPTFRESGLTDVMKLDDETIQSEITTAVHNPEMTEVTAEGADTFTSRSDNIALNLEESGTDVTDTFVTESDSDNEPLF